jgi:hypothetical protein
MAPTFPQNIILSTPLIGTAKTNFNPLITQVHVYIKRTHIDIDGRIVKSIELKLEQQYIFKLIITLRNIPS